MGYRVTAPYVVIKYIGTTGSAEVRGFYEGMLLPDNVDEGNLKHHVDNGMVEELPAASAPESEAPADEAPKGNASRDEWADYAKKQGAADEETRPVEEGGLKQTELRDKYGK